MPGPVDDRLQYTSPVPAVITLDHEGLINIDTNRIDRRLIGTLIIHVVTLTG